MRRLLHTSLVHLRKLYKQSHSRREGRRLLAKETVVLQIRSWNNLLRAMAREFLSYLVQL